MPYIALGFHDIIGENEPRLPRIAGHTTLYTLTLGQFQKHLQAICDRVGREAVGLVDPPRPTHLPQTVLLTFDDGAISSYDYAAAELEAAGWRGHFFVTTDWINRRGFMNSSQIRELRERGHLIGSHSRSHPERFSTLRWTAMFLEWSDSRARLEDITGQAVTIASVPGGFYSREVGSAAAAAGIRVLFTSEPTVSIASVGDCTIVGRYSIRRYNRPAITGSLAAGATWPRREQAALWFAKAAAKRLAGPSYCAVRKFFFARTEPTV